MKIVIEIPEELYEVYKGRPLMLGDAGMDMIAQSIAKGTPLPKEHGRLIDADAIDWFKGEDENGNPCYILDKRDLSLEPTILEADRSDSE